MRKNFIPRNEGFICEQCGKSVGPAPGTFRNHCPHCLTSKHVDQDIPGDRLASCGGLMSVAAVEGSDPEHLDLIHECTECGHRQTNRTAADDSYSAILEIVKSA